MPLSKEESTLKPMKGVTFMMSYKVDSGQVRVGRSLISCNIYMFLIFPVACTVRQTCL